MSSLVRQTRQLERVIRRKEKIFLMEQYAGSMLQQLEPAVAEGQAEEEVIDALRIAYRYVNPELGARLSALLLAFGYSGDLEAEREEAEEAESATFAEEEEEEEEEPQPKAKKGKAPARPGDSAAEGEEDEEAGVLFERDIYTGRKGDKKAKKSAGDEEEDVGDLFADDEEADAPKAAKKKGKSKKTAGSEDEADAADLFADEDDTTDQDADDLFADDDAEADSAEDDPDPKAAKKKGKSKKTAGSEDEEDAADLFAEDEEADSADQDADGLFADDDAEADSADAEADPKAAVKKGKSKKTAARGEEEDEDLVGEEEEEVEGDAAGLLASGKKKKKKKKRPRGEEDEKDPAELDADEAEEGRRFKPTQGHARKETPGFAAPESAVERDEKSRRGRDLFAPEAEDEEEEEAKSKVRKRPAAAEEEEEEEEEERREGSAKPKREARPAAAEEEEKGKKQGKDAQAAEPKAEEKKLNLDALTYQVTIEDLRTHMGISLVREDHVKLIRRWEQKSRDNSIRLLLDDPKATQHPYALIPRITRFVKDGQVVQVNMLNLVRHFFQLFENVPQVIQLKSEPFFVTETPTMEWAIVACEALPDTLNKTVLEQRTIFNHYIQKFMSNERRVRRRVLVEALYDIIVLNMVCKEPILRKTVDLTETRRGRQQQLCINFGAKGIRISSIGRDQRHPQMGMCPSW